MGTFFLFVCAVIGLTHIIVDGALFMPVREWVKNNATKEIHELFECYQCMGFWCGVICGAIIVNLNVGVILGCGFAGSFLANLGAYCLEYLQVQISVELPEDKEE